MKKIILCFLTINLISILTYSQQPISPLVESYEDYKILKEKTPFNVDFIQLGPVKNSARVESIQLDEENPGTMYVAFGSGNLWKTVNNGMSWKPILNEIPSIGIGDIAVAPSNKNILYVGTGESLKKGRNFTMPGTGIYKSSDGGETWLHKGLDDSWHIGEISINPNNPDIVFVSVLGHFWSKNKNRGIFRTIDGGETWDHVLYINDSTGSNDIVISPSNPNIIYSSMWENYPSISGKNSGIYRSVDNGENWINITKGLPIGDKLGRIGLAVSYQNSEKVYALIDNLNKERNLAAEIYSSVNGGKDWERTHKDELLIFPGIGWYFADIYVNPQNDNEIYGLGVRTAYSNDGGKTFKNLEGLVKRINPSAAKGLHLDHCELWINPKNPKHIALGNDGGFFVSYDKGDSWLHYNNIPTGEFYDIEIDTKTPYNIYGGTQDDATVFGPSEELNYNFEDKWKYLWIDAWDGGDGCITQVDPTDNNIIYFSMQNGAIRRKNMRDNISKSIKPSLPESIDGKLNYNFITPYIISNYDNNILYHAGNYVFKSYNKGENWELISNDLVSLSKKNNLSFSAGAFAESEMNKGLLYYGTDRGSFWVTKDDGKNWSENSDDIADAYIRSITPSKYKKSRVYMSMTGINYDDLNNYIYYSENYGEKWVSIKNNLPNEPVNIIVEDHKYENILYAGLHRGLYISFDRGLNWNLFGKNIPQSSISDIEINLDYNDMIVSTHGRGIYKLNLNAVHTFYKIQTEKNKFSDYLIESDEMFLPKFNDTHKEPIMNTYEKIPFSFILDNKKNYKISIKHDNEIIWKYLGEGNKGLNQYRWDLILSKNQNQNPYHIHYNKFIEKGEYILILETDNITHERKLIINESD